jgi:hypothetical protein
MAFLLGSFTQGLFQGMSSTMGVLKGAQELKSAWAAEDAANAVDAASKADKQKQALGGAAAPQATAQTGGMDRHDAAGEGNGPTPPGDLPKIDLNSVPKPAYMTGVKTGEPSAREHDNTTVGPAAAPQAKPAEAPAVDQTPGTSPGENPGPNQKPTGAQTVSNWWDKAKGVLTQHASNGTERTPSQMYGNAGSTNNAPPSSIYGNAGALDAVNHGAIGMPETAVAGSGGQPAQGVPTHPGPQPTPTAQAQTGWHALVHPGTATGQTYLPQQAVPTGSTMPAQQPRPATGNPAPLQMNLASQNAPNVQQMLSGIPGL